MKGAGCTIPYKWNEICNGQDLCISIFSKVVSRKFYSIVLDIWIWVLVYDMYITFLPLNYIHGTDEIWKNENVCIYWDSIVLELEWFTLLKLKWL